ncbi:hypothetical protein CN918_28985 [Priestia megaterium]|nr:hypothetical protein CN918_28985 [Priestia megaterium]
MNEDMLKQMDDRDIYKLAQACLSKLQDRTTCKSAEIHLSQASVNLTSYSVKRSKWEKEQKEKQQEKEKLETEMKAMARTSRRNSQAGNKSSSHGDVSYSTYRNEANAASRKSKGIN